MSIYSKSSLVPEIAALPLSQSSAPSASVIRKNKLPEIIWVLLIATGIAHVGFITLFGFRIAGWAWVVPLVLSVLIVIRKPRQVTFPFFIWAPWILFLTIQLIISDYYALQRTVQLICPVIVAMAVSTYRINEGQIAKFIYFCRRFSIVLFLLALYSTGTLLTGDIPDTTGLAGQGMTCVLMCCLFSTNYAFGEKKDLNYWFLMAGYTVFGMVRITIIGAFATFPLNLGAISVKKRALLITVITLLGILLFYSDRFQGKMFRSGSGTIDDLSYHSENVSDSGRRFMWDMFNQKIENKPWIGYGAGSAEVFTRIITNGQLLYPHNDYLLTLHDYGITGLSLFILTILAAMVHLWKKSKAAVLPVRILFLTGILSFLVFFIMMSTDNIMVYNNFYGNLQFTILGLAYAASGPVQMKGKPLLQK